MPVEQELTIAALTKWVLGEALSSRDFERVVNVFASIPLRVETASPDQIEGAYARFREILRQNYGNK